MFALTLAGHETTSSALTFLLYELSKHQEYQARMREEIRGVRARITARGGNESTIEDLDSLTLTMNAIKVRLLISTLAALPRTNGRVLTVLARQSQETLRFHPIVIALQRVAEKDDVLPLAYPVTSTSGETITEIPVRAGQLIHMSLAGYQR